MTVVIGSNPLPIDAQDRLAVFLDWLDANYEITNGSTALYWELSYMLSQRIQKKDRQ